MARSWRPRQSSFVSPIPTCDSATGDREEVHRTYTLQRWGGPHWHLCGHRDRHQKPDPERPPDPDVDRLPSCAQSTREGNSNWSSSNLRVTVSKRKFFFNFQYLFLHRAVIDAAVVAGKLEQATVEPFLAEYEKVVKRKRREAAEQYEKHKAEHDAKKNWWIIVLISLTCCFFALYNCVDFTYFFVVNKYICVSCMTKFINRVVLRISIQKT